MSKSIAALHSLGPVTAARLAEVGIDAPQALIEAGAVAAYQRLKFRFGKAITLNALYGLDAAVRNVHWREIDDDRKAELRALAEID
jgi:DNA transformation protein